jgi:hypothetical protein
MTKRNIDTQPTTGGRTFLIPKQVAKIRHRTEPALAAERRRLLGPPFIRDGGRVLYDEEALYAWLDERVVDTSGPPRNERVVDTNGTPRNERTDDHND